MRRKINRKVIAVNLKLGSTREMFIAINFKELQKKLNTDTLYHIVHYHENFFYD